MATKEAKKIHINNKTRKKVGKQVPKMYHMVVKYIVTMRLKFALLQNLVKNLQQKSFFGFLIWFDTMAINSP